MSDDGPSVEPLRLGTRGSQLARWQADWVAARLAEVGQPVEIVEIKTTGDAQQVGPISQIAETQQGSSQGVFTKEIQRALLANEVDLAVHSLKDLPTARVEGLTLGAVPLRAPTADVLISRVALSVQELPQGARVGTGSLRRKTQLLHLRPDLVVTDLRGNLDTRLRKLDEGQHDAILLAEAGLTRLGLTDRIAGRIPAETMLPAPGQGALGIECRAGANEPALAAVQKLDHFPSHAAVTAERSAMARLEGGCLAALGALATWEGEQMKLAVVVLSEDGQQRLADETAAGCHDLAAAKEIGISVADRLLSRGASELLRERG